MAAGSGSRPGTTRAMAEGSADPLLLCRRAWQAWQADDAPGAAEAFAAVLAQAPGQRQALRALQYQRWPESVQRQLLPELERLARGPGAAPLLQRVVADWHYRVGERERALAFYRQQRGGAVGGLPEALLIGAPKSGTTSLMAYLSPHPQLWAHPRKELHFFDNRWEWGREWYAAQFPAWAAGCGPLRMEATPNYLQPPGIPERVRELLPAVKLVVLLREPLERAVSWVHHQKRWAGLEGSVEVLLRQELAALEAMAEAERQQLGWCHPNGLGGSLYAPQLARWRAVFPARSLLCLRFEDLRLDPRQVCERVLTFLDLDPERWSPCDYSIHNPAPEPYPRLDPGLAQACRQGVLAEALALWAAL